MRHARTLLANSSSTKTMWQALKKLNVANKPHTPCTFPHVEDLNKHYVSVPLTDVEAIQAAVDKYESLKVPVNDKFHFNYVYPSDLLQAVRTLRSNACGVDCITSFMIKNCIVELSPAILHIFNHSLQHGVFPDLWKIAKVRPLPKKRGASQLKEFRPISLLCILGKLLEKIVHAQTVSYLNSNGLLNPLQSGFKAGHSTASALLKVTGDIREAMGERKLALLVLYDFSNAFPSVHHKLLLSKLKCLGFSDAVLNWFESYLSGRKQFVEVNNIISSLLDIELGVPQGSVLGPLLYCLYVNDIDVVFHSSKFHLYADDLQNYITFHPPDYQTAIDTINTEANNLVQFAASHNLIINSAKTQVIIVGNAKLLKKLPSNIPCVTVGNVNLPFKESVVNLGLTIDCNLNWEAHSRQISKKALGALQSIRRYRTLLPTDVKKKLTECLVFPIIDYCSPVTAGMPDQGITRIQRVREEAV
ncbi:hypothetical protein ONE63_010589 [Megalurothrips usitatus]|uniref:Reverse transcriptase domain-containing protein n=1 Tax=Megalurothrips usitatus TaxID=439358 RepID=A0AAV7XK89_9NEOP|nr:hypothetical protein ONE63_010589 [Megalurothrips usitatus]